MKSKYQLFENLSEKDYQALKADIAERGVIVPVEVDEEGNILDGHHRVRAWNELVAEKKITKKQAYNRIVRANMSEQDKRNHIRASNLLRRHLTKKERVKAWQDMREEGMTLEAIAKVDGTVSKQTVMRALDNDDVFQDGKRPSTITDTKGRKQPTKKKKRKSKPSVVVKSDKEQQRAIDAISKTENLPDKTLDLKRVERIARETEAAAKATEIKEDIVQGSMNLMLGDMRERGKEIESESVDLIFTDPPYPKDFLPLWEDLSALAARVLKPSGMLITYTGAMYLPRVIQLLGCHLTFWWAGSIILSGAHSRVHNRNIVQGSKPLLFYVREGFVPSVWIEDTFKSEQRDKDLHNWEQNIAAAIYYVKKLTAPGAVILDPFLCSATTAVAVKEVGGRSFYGIESDPIALATAKERLESSG